MNIGYLLLAFFIGALIALQGPVNGSLRTAVGSTPVFAAFISFAGGVLVLGAASLIVGEKWSSVSRLVSVEPWQLSGGLIGACFVFGMTLLAPRIGLANMMSLVIAGQIVGSLLYDRFGWVGLAVRELSLARVGGAALVIVGVLLVNFGDRIPWLRS